MRFLVTRPEDDAAGTVRRLQDMGHEALVAPALEIEFLEIGIDADGGWQAWLATSRNGVRALIANDARRDLPLFAVGRSTAELAREAGFSDVRDADGDVDDLARLVRQSLSPADGPLFHGAGRDVAGDLAELLRADGFRVERRVLYRAVPATAIPAAVSSALHDRQIDAILFFSARSAEAFATLLNEGSDPASAFPGMTAICVSPRTAEAVNGLGFGRVMTARRPNQDEMMLLVEELALENGSGRSQ